MIDSDLLHGWWNDRFEEAQDCISCSYTALSSLFELYTRGGRLNHEVKSSGLKYASRAQGYIDWHQRLQNVKLNFVNLGMGGGGEIGGPCCYYTHTWSGHNIRNNDAHTSSLSIGNDYCHQFICRT